MENVANLVVNKMMEEVGLRSKRQQKDGKGGGDNKTGTAIASATANSSSRESSSLPKEISSLSKENSSKDGDFFSSLRVPTEESNGNNDSKRSGSGSGSGSGVDSTLKKSKEKDESGNTFSGPEYFATLLVNKMNEEMGTNITIAGSFSKMDDDDDDGDSNSSRNSRSSSGNSFGGKSFDDAERRKKGQLNGKQQQQGGGEKSKGKDKGKAKVEGKGGWLWDLGRKSGVVGFAAEAESNRASGSLFSGGEERAQNVGSGRREGTIVLGADGMPEWSVLTDRVGGLAQQTGLFELMCFVENQDTDTQVRCSKVQFWSIAK